MPCVINAADIVISRAGAISIAELQAAGKPAIFIPSPNVTGNHQFFNAQVLVENGAGIMLDDRTLNGNVLVKFKAIQDRKELEIMRKEAEDIVRNRAVLMQ